MKDTNNIFTNIIKGLSELLKPYRGNLIRLYEDKGPDNVYKDLLKIKGIGTKIASLIMIELDRWLMLGLPTNIEIPNEAIEGLKNLGLDLEDFDKKYIPIIDAYGWFLRGGSYGKETQKILDEIYDSYRKKAYELKTKLEKSFD